MQLAFDFYDDRSDRPRNPERLFFCLQPDDETRGRLMRVTDRFFTEHRLRGKRLEAERLHVSLHHVGDYRRLRTKFVYAAQQSAKTVSVRPFEMVFRFIQSFEPAPHRTSRRPLVLLGEGGDALAALFRSLGAAMAGNGLKAADHFTPHLTLSYGPHTVPMQPIEPVRFVVRDFLLVHSRLGLTQYEVIGRWSLAA